MKRQPICAQLIGSVRKIAGALKKLPRRQGPARAKDSASVVIDRLRMGRIVAVGQPVKNMTEAGAPRFIASPPANTRAVAPRQV